MSSAPSNPSDPIFLVEVLRAHPGQCVLVHVGTVADPRLILVDGGPPETWEKELKPRLEELRLERGGSLVIDAVISTRSEGEFIGGLRKFLLYAHSQQRAVEFGDHDVMSDFVINNIYANRRSARYISGILKVNPYVVPLIKIIESTNKNAAYHINEYCRFSVFHDEDQSMFGWFSVKIFQEKEAIFISNGQDFARGFQDGEHIISLVVARSFDFHQSKGHFEIEKYINMTSFRNPSIIFTDNLVDRIQEQELIENIRGGKQYGSFHCFIFLYAEQDGNILIVYKKYASSQPEASAVFDVINRRMINRLSHSYPKQVPIVFDRSFVNYIADLKESELLELVRQMVLEGYALPKFLIQPTPQEFHAAALKELTGGDIINKLIALTKAGERRVEAPAPLWQAWLREFSPDTITRIRECLAEAITRRADPPTQ